MPTRRRCSRRSAAAGGTAPTLPRTTAASAGPTTDDRARAGTEETEDAMIKRMVIMLLLVGVVLGGVFYSVPILFIIKGLLGENAMAAFSFPPPTVSTTTAALQDWQPRLEAVGSLRAVNGADLSVEAAGIVEEIKFNSGDDVEAGQLLLRLRTDDDVARLKSLQASAELAQIVYDRDQK